ncbi:MAG: hypothetical protein ACOC56_02980 [Atribacterota bacterium]
MIDFFDDVQNKGSFTIIIMSILAIFVSGIFFGATYYIMDVTEDAFENSNCEIKNNVYVDSCQELWELSVYPFFALKELLIWFSFFFIFALSLGMLILGYKSGKNPVLIGLLMVFVVVLTYGAIEISNIYRTMLENDIFRTMMTDFTVYNKIMLNFPWFIFIVSLLSVLLSIVNYQRTKVNLAEELDY